MKFTSKVHSFPFSHGLEEAGGKGAGEQGAGETTTLRTPHSTPAKRRATVNSTFKTGLIIFSFTTPTPLYPHTLTPLQ
ncbi:hypothetical protein CLI64_05710 [Nostoc sp. CENA543]|nr:hypothetical protein CLI64_05710 [Nostoc sp. CENA543]